MQLNRFTLFGAAVALAATGLVISSAPALAITPYDKHMTEARAADKKGDVVNAYRGYKAAAKAKYRDYQAMEGMKRLESKLTDNFDARIKTAQKASKCKDAKALTTELRELVPSYSILKYHDAANAKCGGAPAGGTPSSGTKARATGPLARDAGHFSNSIFFSEKTDKVDVGKSITCRMVFSKTMIEYAKSFGVNERNWAYAYVNTYLNDELVRADRYSFSSRESKTWEHFDIPISFTKDSMKDVKNKANYTSPQAIWAVSNWLGNPDNLSGFAAKAIPYASKGDFKLTVELGFGEKDGDKPAGIVAKSDVMVTVSKEGYAKLLENGPKWLRPIAADEVGKGTSSGTQFGKEHVVAEIDLPHPLKYYNQKWCQRNMPDDCDYPSGSVFALLSVDGKPYKHHIAKLSDEGYSDAKKLAFVVLPKTDGEMFAPWGTKVNDRYRINQKGLIISTLVDQINGGKIKPGKHTYKLKLVAGNKVPDDMNLTAADKEFYNKNGAFAFYDTLPAIAEVEGDFEISKAGIKAFHKKTYLDVAKKKLRKNKKTEAELKKQLKGAKDVKVLAVNQRFGWDIHYDAFKRPTHRTSSADVYYYNKKTKSHRYLYSRPIKADHKGNNKYGPARWTESMPNHMFSKSHDLIPGMNYPVSGKLKFR